MPRRILRPEILGSEAVNQLEPLEEVFYRRLMSVVDDYGRYDARPSILKAACYPLRLNRVREADITRWLTACQKAGLILLYIVDGKPYLELFRVGEPRAKSSQYPPPPAPSANICAQTGANDPYSYADTDSSSYLRPPDKPGGESALPEGFAAFWAACPPVGRDRSSRKQALASWQKQKLESQADAVICALERWKASAQWTDKAGQYIPGVHRWLNSEKWKETAMAKAESVPEENGFVRGPMPDAALLAEWGLPPVDMEKLK